MKRCYLLLLLLFSGRGVDFERALGNEIRVYANATGYGASGSYYADFVGEGQNWTLTIQGFGGAQDKAPVNFINFSIFDSQNNPLSLEVGASATGFNTSGGSYNNTGQWDRQPSATDFWKTQWASFSANKQIDPFGRNLFVGTFTLSEQATLASWATLYLTGSPNGGGASPTSGSWFGDSRVPDGGSTGALLGLAMLSLGVFHWRTCINQKHNACIELVR